MHRPYRAGDQGSAAGEMTMTALPPGYVIHMPANRRLPHCFGDPVWRPANPLLSRYAQTERTCFNCGAIKVTVHGPDKKAWREWRERNGGEQCRRPEPECSATAEAKAS